MCGLRERGLNQKIKKKLSTQKSWNTFSYAQFAQSKIPEVQSRDQRSETPHEQPRGKKKGFIHRSCLPFDLYWYCKQSARGEKPGERACPNASIPVEVTIWGIASLFAAKPPGKSKNTKTKQRHDISCEGWCQGEEPPGPRTASDGVIFIHVKSPSRSHKHARELLELKLIPQHTHTHTREDRDEL